RGRGPREGGLAGTRRQQDRDRGGAGSEPGRNREPDRDAARARPAVAHPHFDLTLPIAQEPHRLREDDLEVLKRPGRQERVDRRRGGEKREAGEGDSIGERPRGRGERQRRRADGDEQSRPRNDHRGTGTSARTFATTAETSSPSISYSGRSTSLWPRTAAAGRRTSSGVTKSRPAIAAWARAACRSDSRARGLAPTR